MKCQLAMRSAVPIALVALSTMATRTTATTEFPTTAPTTAPVTFTTPGPRPVTIRADQLRLLGDGDANLLATGRVTLAAPRSDAATEKAAFLGVGATPVDAALRTHLDLPKHVGLAIAYVEDGSPAALAGLQQYDVLQKLDAQLLVNAPQLAALVRTFAAGDEVTLGVIRKGKPLTLKATLVERDLPLLADAGEPVTVEFAPLARDPFRAAAEQIRRDARAVEARAVETRQRIDRPRLGLGDAPRIVRMSADATRIISRDDGTHVIELTRRGDAATLIVRDAAGKTLFDGPYDTDAQQQALPADLRTKVRAMQDGIEFRDPATLPAEPKAAIDALLTDGTAT